MNKDNIEVIIFDLGNVVVDFNHWISVNKISHFCNYSPKEIYNMFFDSPLTKLFETGQITPKQFFTALRKKIKCKISYKDFLPIWNQIFFLTSNNLSVHKIIRKVKNRYKIFLLSNINKLHFDYLANSMDGIFGEFDKVILSYKAKMIKPDRKIYNLVRKIAKTKFDSIVYIDDRKDLTDAASKLRIKSIQYKNPRLLKKKLFTLGIKT